MSSLRTLPKAHLHVHLTASMRPTTVAELARRDGLADHERADRWGSFADFSASYRTARAVLRTPGDLRRLVDETVSDAAEHGAVWIEPQTTVSSYAHIVGGEQATIELLLEAADVAGSRHGVGVGLIVSANREMDPAVAERQARLAARYAGRGVVGFGLGGDEAVSARPFATAFAIAREAGLLSVPHAGELAGPESVVVALNHLGADRIQHGVRSLEDPRLLDRLAVERVPLDVCLTSNVALGVTDVIADHPLPKLLRAGVRCSLNADGPLLFATDLLSEYRHARESLGLADTAIAELAATSIQASAAPPEIRRPALRAITNWAARFSP